MANIFDFIPTDGGVADPNAPQRPANIFDSIPATSNVFDGLPINSGNAQLAGDQFLANILHPPIINPALGIHQPGMFSSGFSVQPPSLQNADDWGFTATILPKVLNNAVTRTIGTSLNAAGQALKGDAEAALFQITGQPEAANQELISTAAKMMPSEAAKDQQLGIDTSDPYEDARQTLPVAERIASGIGPGLIQSAPQMALTAVQPELGAASFGFTPDGFDPVQAAAMMIAPAGGRMIGGIAENLAAKAGISSKQALGLINRLGGGTGVASLISAPTVYQIAQMKPGRERDKAIQDAASSTIIAGVLGGMGEHSMPEEPVLTTDDAAQNAVPGPNGEENLPVQAGPAKQQPQKPISQKIDDLHAAIKDIKAALINNQILPKSSEPTPFGTTDELSADGTSQPAQDATVLPASIASNGSAFRPSGESELTPNQIQQSITEAINEKHAKIIRADNVAQRNSDVVRQQAESAFSQAKQREGPVLANTVHDPDFYQTETGQRVQAIANRNGLRVIFYKGSVTSPKGFFSPQDGNLYLRTDLSAADMAADLEHEIFHNRVAAGDPAALRVIAGVDLNSLAAQRIRAQYDGWLLMHGRPPLSPEKLREEIGAFHVSGQNYEGIDPSDAFRDPADEALTAAREYHGARPMEGSIAAGDISFSPGNSAEEKGRRTSIPLVTEAINQLLGTNQLPAAIRVVWDRTAPWVTNIQGRGTIVVNAAKISSAEQAQQAILHEGFGDIWYHRDAQNAWRYVRSKLTADELTATLERRKAQGLPTDSPAVHEETAIARLTNSDGRDRVARNFHNAIRKALKERFGFNIPATAHPQLNDAATQFLRNRTAQVPGIGLPPKAIVPLGQWGEAWLRHVLRGTGIKPSSPLKTKLTYRFPDRVFNKIVHEAKAGLNVKLNDSIRMQILKDRDLIRNSGFAGAHWHFFRGAQPDVLKFLDQNGIGYTVY